VERLQRGQGGEPVEVESEDSVLQPVRRGAKQAELEARFTAGHGASSLPGDRRLRQKSRFPLFQLHQQLLGPFDDFRRQPGQACDLDAVTAVGAPGDELVEKEDLVLPFLDGNVEVFHPAVGMRQIGEFMVMGGEEGFHADPLQVVEILGNRPGDAQAVKGAGSPADLVQDDQAPGGRLMQDVGAFLHFDEKGRAAAGQVVARADAGEDPIHQADGSLGGGNETADLGQEHNERRLPQDGRFSRHVRPGDDQYLLGVLVEFEIVGDKGAAWQEMFDNWVAPVADNDGIARAELRLAVIVAGRDLGQAGQAIEIGNPVSHELKALTVSADLFAEPLKQLLFELQALLLGFEHLRLEGFQGFGKESLGIDQGLLAEVIVGDGAEVGLGNLEVIAEDFVVPDLERADPGALALLGFVAGHPASGIPAEVHIVIQLRTDAWGDNPPGVEGQRGRIGEAGFEQFCNFSQVVPGVP